MSRAVSLLVVLLLAVCAGCDRAEPSGSSSSSRPAPLPTQPPPPPSASEVPPSATTTPPVDEPPTPERPPAVRVAPKNLAVSWSSYLGQRVSLRCRPVRRIDFTRTLITASGARFVVTGPPNLAPCGSSTSTFTVIGTARVSIAGRTVLPELLLDEDDGEDGAR